MLVGCMLLTGSYEQFVTTEWLRCVRGPCALFGICIGVVLCEVVCLNVALSKTRGKIRQDPNRGELHYKVKLNRRYWQSLSSGLP